MELQQLSKLKFLRNKKGWESLPAFSFNERGDTVNERLGTIISALIIDENENNYFAQIDGITYRLMKTTQNHQIGEMVQGFAYVNHKGEAMLTESIPTIQQGRYDFASVTKVRKDLGVFVDIGLPDKEIVVSLDFLPSEARLWPKVGDQLLVALTVDKKDRIWAEPANDDIFRQIAIPPKGKEKQWRNQEVEGIVYHAKLVGSYVLTSDYHLAFIHESEREEEPRLGQKVNGRIIGIGQFHTLNLSLKPLAYEMISEDAQMILALLTRQPDHFLPYHDKSDPQAIREYFNISKAQFKRALGNLLKHRKVIQETDGIRLKEESH